MRLNVDLVELSRRELSAVLEIDTSVVDFMLDSGMLDSNDSNLSSVHGKMALIESIGGNRHLMDHWKRKSRRHSRRHNSSDRG